MQHETGPTWCRDCGRFDFACGELDECPAAGSGAYDQGTEVGRRTIATCLYETFGQDDALDAAEYAFS